MSINNISPTTQGYREPEFSNVTFLKIESYSNHPEVIEAAKILVCEFKKTRQQIRNENLYFKDAKKLIASLWLHGEAFRFTTKKEYFSKGKRKQVWMTNRVLDLFKLAHALQWFEVVKGAIPPNLSKSDKGYAAIYQVTESFKKLLTNLSSKDIYYDEDLPLVILKVNKLLVEQEPSFYKTNKYKKLHGLLTSQCKRLIQSNARWGDGTQISSSDLILTAIFNDDFSHGGRFYCNFQNKPKSIRNGITIEGEKVGSLDITQCHPMLLMRIFMGKQSEDSLFFPHLDDVYDILNFSHLNRAIRKMAVNALFNAKGLDEAVKALLNTHWWIDGITDEVVTKTYKGKAKRYGSKIFKDKAQVEDFINAFKLSHSQFVDYVCTGIGLKLMNYDAKITHKMLKLADKFNIPIIPIHEEYLCRESDKNLVIECLGGAVRWALGESGNFGNLKAKWTNSLCDETEVSILLSD